MTETPKRKILVVCTANICRSPAVAGMIETRLAVKEMADLVTVTSAGVFAQEGYGADPIMAAFMQEAGVDLSNHVSHPLGLADVTNADLIIVMEEAHRTAIFHRWPRVLYKVLLLSELAGEHADLDDPHGGTDDAYLQAIALAEEWLDKGWALLQRRLDLPA